METPLDVLSRAASLVHADDEKREAALRGEPRMQPLPVSPALPNHRTGPPPISPGKRKLSMDQGDEELDCESDHVSKMSRMFNPHLNKTANGDYRKEHRERSRSPIERAAAPTMSLHANHMYASIPSLTMDQPLALTKNSMDATRTVGITPTLTSVERQQNRPSVITCASANNRNCNLSHCPIAHSGCAAGPAYRRPSSAAPACDPVVEEHFRRSLGKNYKEPEPVANSVSITGSSRRAGPAQDGPRRRGRCGTGRHGLFCPQLRLLTGTAFWKLPSLESPCSCRNCHRYVSWLDNRLLQFVKYDLSFF